MSISPMTEEIDAVYLWIDEDDRSDAVNLAKQYKKQGYDISSESYLERRFRNREELRFSLRSIWNYAPWIRKIFIITASKTPTWLNVNHDKIHIIRHEEIFENHEILPTFNSLAIETNFDKIPGLSEYFLYFNDDFFLGRSLEKKDLFSENSPVIFRQNSFVARKISKNGSIITKAADYTLELIEKNIGDIGKQHQPLHAPYFLCLDRVCEIYKKFYDDINITRQNRFRSATDVSFTHLYSIYHSIVNASFFKEKIYELGSEDFYFICLSDMNLMQGIMDLWGALLRRPKFLCINDDTCKIDSLKDKILSVILKIFFRVYFPTRAGWENS